MYDLLLNSKVHTFINNNFILCGDQVEFSPTRAELARIVGTIASHLTECISLIRRLPDVLTRKKSQREVSLIPDE